MVSGTVAKAAGGVLGLSMALSACGRTQQHEREVDVAAAGHGGGGRAAAAAAGRASADQGGAATSGGLAGAGQGGQISPTPGAGGESAAGRVSPGCGKALSQQLGTWQVHSVHVSGKTLDPDYSVPAHDRAYQVWLPREYDGSQPYRTVFLAGGCGTTGEGDSRYTSADGDAHAIYVSLAAPPASLVENSCFDNRGARSTEWEYFALVADAVEGAFCVDKEQEVVAGVHSGGMLSNMLGCYFSGVDEARVFGPSLNVRAQVSIAAAEPQELPACGGAVATLLMYDTLEYPPIDTAYASLSRILAANGCTDSPTEVWGSGPLQDIGCRKYTACPAAYPVVFCETTGRGRQANYYSITAPAEAQFVSELAAPQ